ncbi:MAG: hypothetical protein ACI9MR_002540 [Myxococcota bacterium]|jgi:uncharacterized protein YijF (DUF1287 family)
MARRDRLIDRSFRPRKRRRFPRAIPMLFMLGGLAGIVILWVWVFAPIFVEPREWHARQLRFDRAISAVINNRTAVGGEDVPNLPPWPPPLNDDQTALVACAERQVARGVRFSGGYHALKYPNGDLAAHLGTSPDIVIRCLRDAGLDLQQLIHVDRKNTPGRYPTHLWSSRRADPSIDHRRLPNLYRFAKWFFDAQPLEADTPETAVTYLPGDIVFWKDGGYRGFPGLVGIVTDRRGADGVPRVVTLLREEKRATLHHPVTGWTIAGHFRIRSDHIRERFLETHPGTTLVPAP